MNGIKNIGISKGTKTLFDFLPDDEVDRDVKDIDITEAERLAETKYRDDPNLQTWLKIYRHGTSDIKTKEGKIKGISPHSEIAKRGLIKSIQLRETGKIRHK